MLLTEQQLCRRQQAIQAGGDGSSFPLPQPERLKKVAKSMKAIRHVLGERKAKKVRKHLDKQQQQQQQHGERKEEEKEEAKDEEDKDHEQQQQKPGRAEQQQHHHA